MREVIEEEHFVRSCIHVWRIHVWRLSAIAGLVLFILLLGLLLRRTPQPVTA